MQYRGNRVQMKLMTIENNEKRNFCIEFKYLISFFCRKWRYFLRLRLNFKETCIYTYDILFKMWGLLIAFSILHKHLSWMYSNNQRAFCASLPAYLFSMRHVLMETLPVFVTDGAKTDRKEIQMRVEELHLERYITSHILVQLFSYNLKTV